MADNADQASDTVSQMLFPDADLLEGFDFNVPSDGLLHEADIGLALLLHAPEQRPDPIDNQTAVRPSNSSPSVSLASASSNVGVHTPPVVMHRIADPGLRDVCGLCPLLRGPVFAGRSKPSGPSYRLQADSIRHPHRK